MKEPVKGYFRLYPGNEVRLKTTYIVKCTGFKEDDDGNVTEVYAEYDPETRGGNAPDGRKIKGTIHWVNASTALDATVNLYENLFTVPDPDSGDKNFMDYLNPHSLEVLKNCKVEPFVRENKECRAYQFMRLGYFCLDKDSKDNDIIFNRSVSLKDSFKKKQ